MSIKIFRGFETVEEIKANYLPLGNAKPQDVIDQGILPMSLATLYRALEDSRFFAVIPSGAKNGRVLPLWQFVEPVPELLPRILHELRTAATMEINSFLVSECEELNDLSPAEVIAGKFFENRTSWYASQEKLLGPPGYARQELVLRIIKRHSLDE